MYAVVPSSLVVASLLVLGATASDRHAGAAAPHAATPGHRAEVARIRAHFDSVLAVLPSRDVAALTAAQQSNRATLLQTLRGYRDAGVFPHNYDFPEVATPYFVDRKTGTLCAVAYLMESTGRRDIVDRVARADNNVRVHQLAGDTAFNAWLAAHGLTLDEAAWIQVPYVTDETPMASVGSRDPMYNMASTLSTAGATTLGLVNALGNRDGHGRLRNFAGMTAGALSLGVGVAGLASSNASPLAAASLVTGGLSMYVSTRGFLRHRELQVVRRETERARSASTTISPIVPVGGTRTTGVSVAIRF